MRQGVTFHNGKDVTAEDAWFSIQRVADPKAPLSGGGQLSQILDFESTQGGRRDHARAGAEGALRDPRRAAGGVHRRHHPDATSTSRTPWAPAPSPTSPSTPARPAPSPGTPTTGATRPSSTSCRSRTSPTPAPWSTPCRRARSRPSTSLPYNLIDTIKGAGGGVLVSETGAWVPFTMRVDQAPFNDVKVRQAMRLIVDRQQMIDQTLSGYGSLGNDMYAPLDVAYASDLPQREQDIDQAKSLLASAGQEGLQVELFTGDDIGSVAPAAANLLRRAGQARRRRRQGHQEDAVLRRPVPPVHLRPGLLEHPQLHPAGRGRHVPAGAGRHLQRDPLGQPGAPRPGQRRGPGARRDQARPSCSTTRRRSSTTRAA